MISRPRATSSRTSSSGSSSRSATRCIWGVMVPWRARYCWVTQSIPTPFAGADRIRFKGCDLSSPGSVGRAPLSLGNLIASVRRGRARGGRMLSRRWRSCYGGVVDLLPLRAERERIGTRGTVEREDAVEMIDLVLQQLCHRSLQLHHMLLALQVGVGEGRRVG